MNPDDHEDIDAFVRANHDRIVRVLRHSSNETARAYAWALLDYVYEAPELEALHEELAEVTDGEEVSV